MRDQGSGPLRGGGGGAGRGGRRGAARRNARNVAVCPRPHSAHWRARAAAAYKGASVPALGTHTATLPPHSDRAERSGAEERRGVESGAAQPQQPPPAQPRPPTRRSALREAPGHLGSPRRPAARRLLLAPRKPVSAAGWPPAPWPRWPQRCCSPCSAR